MTKRIFRTTFAVAISIFLACALLFMTVLYDYFSGIQLRGLHMQTEFAAKGVESAGLSYLQGLNAKDYRITWVGTDGKVLYDSVSDADKMENHFAREEIKEALAQGYGSSTRYSATLMQRYLYGAKRLDDGTVIRLSITQHSLLVLMLGMLQPMIVIFVIAIVLSAFLASRLAKKIVSPLNKIDLDKPLDHNGYDELSPLLRRIDAQQREIGRQSEALKQKQKEFEAMTSSMAEGIVLLGNRGNILSMNEAAARLFEVDHLCTGEDILSVNRTLELTDLLNQARNGAHAEKIVKLKTGSYQMIASPVTSNETVSGIVLLLLDVTEKEKAEQLRREFTANVSHELKTPLHTISGSAELMANGMVKPEDIPNFANRIYSEAQRMIQLVEDIIRLSHLDEGAEEMKRESVDLYPLAKAMVNTLSDEAKNANVTLELHGEDVSVYGVRELIQGIIYNLCDNAIKYNHSGGSVQVTVAREHDFAILCVADTGMGIPAEHQSRVFERFYRVDQSHSREIGGTGLGLSIVKHAARLHHAEITLQSVVKKGTTVTVKFPLM